jgi:protein-tyrosine phosphatase
MARGMELIDSTFGTARGAVRLALAQVQVLSGGSRISPETLAGTRRLVFVCLGNICRSAFADAVARAAGANAVSAGLSTHAGGPAHPPVVAEAARMGYDMSAHRTTPIAEYEPREGDLLLVMEVRQLAALDRDPRLVAVPKMLLGAWARPWLHLHDPYMLGDAYLPNCLKRIERATKTLVAATPGTLSSTS